MSAKAPQGYISGLSVRQRISRPQPKGLPVISMGYNELPYPTSQSVQEALAETAKNANRYGSALCTPLRNALAAQYGLDADCLICGNGSEELLDVLGRCFARPGDSILISEFGYIQFSFVAHRLGVQLVRAPETAYTCNVDNILSGVDENTKLIFLANPNNPTGTMLPESELERLADALPRHVVLVLDLAYGEFVSEDYCAFAHQLVEDHENVVVTRTFSKVFGLAGLRVGWCHAPRSMMAGLYAARGMGSVNAFAQAAAIAALGELETVAGQVAETVSERNRMLSGLRDLDLSVVDSHANFVMCAIKGDDGERASALTEYLFDEAGIVVGPVREPGLERFVRFSLSLPEHNGFLLDTVKAFLQGPQS